MLDRISPLLAALCFVAAAVCLGLFGALFVQPAVAQAVHVPAVCDIDQDGDIDLADLVLIRAGNGTPAAPGDPRDANQDGRINVADVRFCQLVCTRARCAEF